MISTNKDFKYHFLPPFFFVFRFGWWWWWWCTSWTASDDDSKTMTAYDQTLAHHHPFPPKPNQTKSRPIGDGYMNLFSIQSLSKALGSVLSEKPISLSTIASKVDQKNTE